MILERASLVVGIRPCSMPKKNDSARALPLKIAGQKLDDSGLDYISMA